MTEGEGAIEGFLDLSPDELIVDGFAGGGGTSVGIEQATGRPVDIAINHSPLAMLMHRVNHPRTRHLICDIFEADPIETCGGRPVGLFWVSPDCTFHSVARGGKPFRDRRRALRKRGLARVAIVWAKVKRPRVIILENVKEFEYWGPLLENGKPCPDRLGLNFRRFVAELRNLGYAVAWQNLKACDFGDPTSRERLFVVARCDGAPIRWPEPTHGPGRAYAWRTAGECLDFSIPCPSIFLTKEEAARVGVKRPLAENTMRRIASGVFKFVINDADPFIVPARRGSDAMVMPLISAFYGDKGKSSHRCRDVRGQLPTQTGDPRFALVAAFLAKHYGGHETPGSSLCRPMDTITGRDHNALVTSHLMKLKGTCRHGQSLREPLHTIAAGGNHFAEVRAFLIKFYSMGGQWASLKQPMPTITATDRLGLVTVQGEDYMIADIGMRMLTPRELFRGNGFPNSYIIDPWVDDRRDKLGRRLRPGPLSADAQVDLCGNSVPPGFARAMVQAQFERAAERGVA